jgi:hypothetical protein
VVTEQFLDGSDVVAGFEEGCGEAVAKGVAGGGLGKAGDADGLPEGALKDGFVKVVASYLAGL